MKLEIEPETLSAGMVVGDHYELVRVVGEGGMGVVWAARDLRDRSGRALKFLRPSRADEIKNHERLLREARALCAVRHPNVAEVMEVQELPSGLPFLVMELLTGETLAEVLARSGRLSPHATAELLLPVLDAVAAVHDAGIVHRDLKPENIFLARSEGWEGTRIKVLDFGVAKIRGAAEPALTTTGGLVGTSFYMAPEQAFGEADVDARADVWSLGIIAYQCLSGILPTKRDVVGQVLKAITSESLPGLGRVAPDLPEAIVQTVDAMLSRSREARPSVPEVRDAFLRLTDERAPALPVPSRTGNRSAGRRPYALLGVTSLGLVVLAAVRLAPSPAAPRVEPPDPASEVGSPPKLGADAGALAIVALAPPSADPVLVATFRAPVRRVELVNAGALAVDGGPTTTVVPVASAPPSVPSGIILTHDRK